MKTRDLMIILFLSMAVLFLCQTGRAAPIFNAKLDFAAGDEPWSVAIGDLDGDGVLDLAVANSEGGNVSVLLGNGDGTFQSAVNYGAGDCPRSVAIGDLDGDGALDLAVANLGWIDMMSGTVRSNGTVSVLLGNGDGTFHFQSAVNYGGEPLESVAIGDLDGDGDLDLAVVNRGSPGWGGSSPAVSVLLGNGNGTFRRSTNYGVGNSPYSVAIGDLDGDNDLDLAVANSSSDNVSVLLGNGNGTFQNAVNYGADNRPWSVAIGDLDGDGDLDLAVANTDSDNVSVLLGNGDGTFQSAVNYGAGVGLVSVAIGDLDRDGALDLAVANSGWQGSEYVSVLLGNGDGTFQSAVHYAAGEGPRSVAIGDLDGDGALDLAVADYLSDYVSVFINSLVVYPKVWSMISLPVDLPDKRLNKLFPDAVVVYRYEKGTGYVRVQPDEDLEVGRGYWILLDKPRPYITDGTEITEYTISVEDGWYMIGGCSSPAQKVVTTGEIDVIYGYTQGKGYTRLPGSQPLERGKGYWILFSNTSEGAAFTASTSALQ